MEFQSVVRNRRMVRSYSADPVDPAIVDRVLQNALHAPSAGFSQGWAFLVLDQPPDVDRFWRSTTPAEGAGEPDSWLRGMRTAPVVIVPMSCEAAYQARYAEPDKGWTDQESRWAMPYWHIDAGMATLLMLLTAVDEGLGACFFGLPPEQTSRVRAEFGVPERYAPIGAITVGHRATTERAAGSGTTRRRREVGEVVHRGRWSS